MKEKEVKLKEINTLQNQMRDLKTKSDKSMELESKANEKLMETEELNFKNQTLIDRQKIYINKLENDANEHFFKYKKLEEESKLEN